MTWEIKSNLNLVKRVGLTERIDHEGSNFYEKVHWTISPQKRKFTHIYYPFDDLIQTNILQMVNWY
jgi:hypothetical protein